MYAYFWLINESFIFSHLSTFAFQSDESGKLILGALHDAADRGVHVRLLVDGMESWVDMEGNPYFYGLSSHKNVEIKLYNKANPLKPWKMMGSHYNVPFVETTEPSEFFLTAVLSA